MNMVLDGRTVWFAGGFKDGYKGHTIAEVWSYDIDQDRYTAAPLLPAPRAGGGLAVIGSNLHYFGGLMIDRDTDSSDHWVLDLDAWALGSAKWSGAAPMPVPRNQFSTVVFDEKIYAIGGQFHHDSMQLDQPRVDIYDPVTNSWSRGPDLPKGHSHAEGATFVHNDQIFMFGGHTTPAGGTKSTDRDILRLAKEGGWEKVGELPVPLSSPAAAIIQGKLYVSGGALAGSQVQDKMWTALPPWQ
jgi:N-acetylneuraminic acid mutarotase